MIFVDRFIPKQYKNEPVTIRVSEDTLVKLDELAASFEISRNSLINQCIRYALEQCGGKQDGSGNQEICNTNP